MSLSILFDDATVSDMMTAWPTKPALHKPPEDSLVRSLVNANLVNSYLDTGTAPADQLIVIRDGAGASSGRPALSAGGVSLEPIPNI